MTKVVIDPVTSGYSLSKINANLELLAAELNNKVLYRDNPVGEPNSLSNDVDMNSNDILNINWLQAATFTLAGVPVVPNGILTTSADQITVTPVGNIVATDTQAAIEELDAQDTTHASDKTTHGTTGDILGTTDAQAVSNKTISASDVTVGAGKTLDVSAGTFTLADNQISGDKIHGGTQSNFASTGIDDNAATNVITIASNSRVNFTGGGNAFEILLKKDAGTGGVYLGSPAADTFQISTAGGSERLTVDGSGNLSLDGTVDGRDVAADGATLDALVAGTFSESFVSTEQTITSAGALVIAHGLSAEPKLLQFRAICKTAERNYSIGDEVILNNGYDIDSTVSRGLSAVPDATNVNIRMGGNATAFGALDKTTGAAAGLTNTNWRLIVRAWA